MCSSNSIVSDRKWSASKVSEIANMENLGNWRVSSNTWNWWLCSNPTRIWNKSTGSAETDERKVNSDYLQMNIIRDGLGRSKWQNNARCWLRIRVTDQRFAIENALGKHDQRLYDRLVVRANAQFDMHLCRNNRSLFIWKSPKITHSINSTYVTRIYCVRCDGNL